MASGKLLRMVIKSGAQGNIEEFRQACDEVIKEEREKHHHLLANDLERILYNQPRKYQELKLNNIPLDQERDLPLLVVRETTRSLDDVVLSSENRKVVDLILREYHYSEVLKSNGLRPVDKVLFFGPPGCGKTLLAEAIAGELSRPFAVVRLDSVISSYLGETAANLRKIFDYIESSPMVVLIDEFDAFAKERSIIEENSELKRVVNAFLQMMDNYKGKSFIIAATNHESILDSAIWRRFEEVLLFGLPNIEELYQLVKIKLRGVRRNFEIEDKNILGFFSGISHADVERILRRAIKNMLLQRKEFLEKNHLENAIIAENVRRQKINMDNAK